jgi:acetyltransferase-like isoleucine patch superfamily enzyme
MVSPFERIRGALGGVYSNYVKPMNGWIESRRAGVSVDPTARVALSAKLGVSRGGSITIGRETRVRSRTMLFTYGGDIDIGDNCTVHPQSILYGHGGLSIGDGVRIAAGTIAIPANHVYEDTSVPIHTQGETREGIVIEEDVWIGAGCRILDGVTIHTGSVLGAGSVVTESIPERSVAVGVPARVVESRD